MSKNPYQDLGSERYWRSGVAEHASTQQGYPHLWQAKFPITPTSKIITIGSCFAQHISKWIQGNGFTWLDSEPGPADRSTQENEQDGYGIFSFRVGNIYTPALLKQWVLQALGKSPSLNEVFFQDGRYYDPFRPLIPADGFDSQRQLEASRTATLQAIAKSLQETDLMIFTLGLTEAWQNIQGYVYPVCPGTLKGVFDPQQHRFVNWTYEQIAQDLKDTFDAVRSINPRARFLLTVSPVPLTATASDHHALVATTYSKSVLRAVAGDLAEQFADVDYFPSYELIAQFPEKGRFYEDNLRSVKPDGVQFVMRHFERGIGIIRPSEPRQQIPAVKAPLKKTPQTVEEYCEDILLDDWNQTRPHKINQSDVQVFLMGDSHLDATGGALAELGIANEGGMIMRGHTWAAGGFALDPEEILVPLDGPAARTRWRTTIAAIQESTQKRKILITNAGLHTNVNIPHLVAWAQGQNLTELSSQDIANYFCSTNAKHIELIKAAQAHGLTCLVITDPPTQTLNPGFVPWIPLLAQYELVACQIYEDLGCATINVRSHYPDGIPPEYFSRQKLGEGPDWVHGSPEYYAAAASLLSEKITELKNS